MTMNPGEKALGGYAEESSEPDDAELVDAALSGDDGAYSKIVRRYQQRVFNLAFRMVQDFDDAHDVAQDTFIRAHAKLGSFRKGSSLFTWVYRIALNNSINLLRKRNLHSFFSLDLWTEGTSEILAANSLLTAPPGRADLGLEAAEIRERVATAVARLPARQRSVFVLRQFDRLSHREISEVVGCTEGSVRASYYHAIKKLQEALCDLR